MIKKGACGTNPSGLEAEVGLKPHIKKGACERCKETKETVFFWVKATPQELEQRKLNHQVSLHICLDCKRDDDVES